MEAARMSGSKNVKSAKSDFFNANDRKARTEALLRKHIGSK